MTTPIRSAGLAERRLLIYELNFMSEISQSSQLSQPSGAPVSGHTTRRLETRRRLLEAGTVQRPSGSPMDPQRWDS